MSTIAHPTGHETLRQTESGPGVANRYGRFAPDGREYVITDVQTPRPWINVISNPRVGLAISHTGSGFSWIDNSQLAVLTRWDQDLTRDSSGKFLYVRDAASGKVWSAAPAPTWPAFDHYECRHGLGYTTFVTECEGIRATWTLFVDAALALEYWMVSLENRSSKPRRLELTAFAEWNCGVLPSPRREFHKLFLETSYDPARHAVFAVNHMWDVPNERFGHWNTSFPYVTALACSEALTRALGDKTVFLGRYGDFRAPAALAQEHWPERFGRHDDASAILRSAIELKPGQSRSVTYVLAAGKSQGAVEELIAGGLRPGAAEAALQRARQQWSELLSSARVETPEPTLNWVVNDWSRYQAIAGRIWGRAGYYQQSGAYGFRDQLQDSQIWLTIDPRRCREQINLHAAHQFADGSVYHWWHPLTEQGHVTKMTDDLLWLGFVTANYVKETGDLSVLWDKAPFLDERTPRVLLEHVLRAFGRVFGRISPRGLPYIGAGDWNDGLSACGLQEKGESVWLGHFLVGLLADWAEILRRVQRGGAATPDKAIADCGFRIADCGELAANFEARRAKLIAAINEHAWDGQWYTRGTLDDGTVFGTSKNRVGKIFLNAQTWAILNDVAPPDRAAACWAAVRQHLVSEAGALLLAPAFDQPVSEIGYITRYAPGLRENGGVYTHAATWAIAAAAKMRDRETLAKLLKAINPALKDPERYWAEPYVLPGNVDGPDSPYYGRAGWTWYTGSAQWLGRVVSQWVLGVRPEWAGLRFDPCLPAGWERARLTRPWRGATLEIEIERGGRGLEVSLNGQGFAGGVLEEGRRVEGRGSVKVWA